MGRTYPVLTEQLIEFIKHQPVFFVGTAPLRQDGLINVSPKGLKTLAVIDPHTVAYLDLTGSGIETVAHLKENGRIVLMFCAFEGSPKILRLHGRGDVIEPADPTFNALAAHFSPHPGARAIVRIAIQRIGDSCGFTVPLMRYQRDREQLTRWSTNKGRKGLETYRQANNATSLDGLPGLHGD